MKNAQHALNKLKAAKRKKRRPLGSLITSVGVILLLLHLSVDVVQT